MNHVNMRLLGGHVPYTRGLPAWLVMALVWRGQQGVQIFFAVSGFLITLTSIRRWGSLGRVRAGQFYWIRLARIAPLLLALLAVLSVLHGAGAKDFVVAAEEGGLPGALTAALTLRIGWLEATRGYLPGNWDILWSLSVEEMFYLAFPLACWWLRGRWLVAVLGLLVIAGPFGRTVLTHGNPVWQEYSYLGGMDAIAMGCLAAMMASRWQFGRTARRAMLGAGVALLTVCLLAGVWLYRVGAERHGLGMTLVAFATCLIMVPAAQSGWRAPRVFLPVLNAGRRSYEIYLTHMFVVYACFDFFVSRGKPLAGVLVLFAGTIVLAAAGGELVGRLFSEPANRWLRMRPWFRSGTPVEVG